MKQNLLFVLLLLSSMGLAASAQVTEVPALTPAQKAGVEAQLEQRFHAKFFLRGKANVHEHMSDAPNVRGLDLPLSGGEEGNLPGDYKSYDSPDKARAHLKLCQPGFSLVQIKVLGSVSQLSADKTMIYTAYKFEVVRTIYGLNAQLSQGEMVLAVLPGGEVNDAGERLRVHAGPLRYVRGRSYVVDLKDSVNGVYMLNFSMPITVKNDVVTFPEERCLDVRSGSQVQTFKSKLQKFIAEHPCTKN
jgi:hypothetical protein